MSLTFTPVTSFDAVGDFTVTTAGVSDNGCWQYGWLPDLSDPAADFTLDDVVSMTWGGITGFSGHYSPEGNAIVLGNLTRPPATIAVSTISCPVGMLVSGPSGVEGSTYGALRFVAPASGPCDVTGTFEGLDVENTTVDVHVIHVKASDGSSASLFDGYVDGFYGGYVDGFYGGDADAPTGPTPVVPFSLKNVPLAAGDQLVFAIGNGGNGYDNDTTGVAAHIGFSPRISDNPLGYLGGLGYWQGETEATGLTYVRQRWLENGTGQWLSVDPVATEPRYGYAHNSPTMRVDPSGMQDTSTSTSASSNKSQPIPPGYLNHPRHDTTAQQQSSFAAVASAFSQMTHAIHQANSAGDAWYESYRRNWPLYLRNIAPPSGFYIGDSLKYEWGYNVGFYQTVINLVPGVGVVGFFEDLCRFAVYLFQHRFASGNFFEKLSDFMSDQLVPLFSLLESQDDLDPEKRGELFGIFVGSALVLIVSLIELAVTVGVLTPLAVRNILALTEKSRTFLGEIGSVRFEVVEPVAAGGAPGGGRSLVIKRTSRVSPAVETMAKNPAAKGLNPESIKGKAYELIRHALPEEFSDGIVEPTRPRDSNAVPDGIEPKPQPDDDASTRYGILSEVRIAKILAKLGYKISYKSPRENGLIAPEVLTLNPGIDGRRVPDFTINRIVVDNYAPLEFTTPENIADVIMQKANKRQAFNIIVDMGERGKESTFRDRQADVIRILNNNRDKSPNLRQVIFVRHSSVTSVRF